MRIAEAVVVVLAVVGTPVLLVLTGPGWLAAGALAVVASVILSTRIAAQRDTRLPGDATAPTVDVARTHESVAPAFATSSAPERARATACTDEELCWEWRRSFAQLQRSTDPIVLSLLVAQRQAYLDELEHRHPARFAAWISSGARAASDPHPFITARRTP